MARAPVKGPLVIQNGIQVVLHWVFSNRNITNVLHGTLSSTPPDFDALANTLFTGVKAQTATTAWLALCSPDLSLVAVSVKDLRTKNQADHRSQGVAVAGTGTGQPAALNSACVVTLRTSQSGPGFRGRVYMAGFVSETGFDGIHVPTDISNAAVAFVQGVQTVMNTNSIPLGVGQRSLAADPTAPAGSDQALPRNSAVVPVTSVVQENLRIDSQRRRTGR